MQKIIPCLWSDGRAEEAAKFYTDLFGGRITDTRRNPDGTVLTMHFELFGQTYMLLNGGPQFKYTEAVSFSVDCADQAEVDRYWTALTADGGEESMCGWCKDRFGMSWQIVPRALIDAITGPDSAGAQRAVEAMLKMHKIDVATIEKAYAGA